MKKIFGKRNIIFLSILVLTFIFSTACSNDTANVLSEFEKTTWETGLNSIYFSIDDNSMKISIKANADSKPSDFKLDNFNSDKYIIGQHDNISIEKTDENIRIYNDDELDLEFKIISESELEDKDGNIFKKK